MMNKDMKFKLIDNNLFALNIKDISGRLLEPNWRNRERIEYANFHRCNRIWWQAINKPRRRLSKQQIIIIIINGKLPENCDLLDLGKKLMRGDEVPEMQEEEGLDVDIILVVISAENVPVPQSFVDEIYKEANMKKKRELFLV